MALYAARTRKTYRQVDFSGKLVKKQSLVCRTKRGFIHHGLLSTRLPGVQYPGVKDRGT